MTAPDINPVELKVFLNHIYEYKKGVRQMVLYTTNRKYEAFAVNRLKSQRIKFVIQPVDEERINLFFGKAECINAIRLMVTRPLNLLTPEEDFILGAMLGMIFVHNASVTVPARHAEAYQTKIIFPIHSVHHNADKSLLSAFLLHTHHRRTDICPISLNALYTTPHTLPDRCMPHIPRCR